MYVFSSAQPMRTLQRSAASHKLLGAFHLVLVNSFRFATESLVSLRPGDMRNIAPHFVPRQLAS